MFEKRLLQELLKEGIQMTFLQKNAKNSFFEILNLHLCNLLKSVQILFLN